jgi:hypothetical protein
VRWWFAVDAKSPGRATFGEERVPYVQFEMDTATAPPGCIGDAAEGRTCLPEAGLDYDARRSLVSSERGTRASTSSSKELMLD